MGIIEGPFQNVTSIYGVSGFVCTVTVNPAGSTIAFILDSFQDVTVDWGDGNPVAYNNDYFEESLLGDTVVFRTEATGFDFEISGTNCTAIDITGGATLVGLTRCFRNKPNIASLADITVDDTSNVEIWNSTFALNSQWDSSEFATITDFDFSSATTLQNCFNGLSGLTSFPSISVGASCTSFAGTWQNCSGLTSFPLLTLSSGQIFTSAWSGCSSLTGFPAIAFSSATLMFRTWQNCTGLTSFGLITFGTSVFTAVDTWRGCSSLTSFPAIDFKNCSTFTTTWFGCTSMTTFGNIDCSVATVFTDTWKNNTAITSFAGIDMSGAVTVDGAFEGMTGISGGFPSITFSSALRSITAAFAGMTGVTSFPSWDLSVVTDASFAFQGCTGLSGTFQFTNFASCLNFTSMLSACSGITGAGTLSTGAGTTFDGMFENCSSLVIINGIDTRNTVGASTDMFTGCSSMTDPNSGEQSSIASSGGDLYVYVP